MEFDRDRVAPSGRTYAQIDAEQAEYVRAANAALASAGDKGACWSSYWSSHDTFELLVGDPTAEDNIVLSMPECESLSGPVRWPAQRLEIVFRCDRRDQGGNWEFEFRDVAVGFRAVGKMFRWRRGYDLRAQGGLWFGRGAGPAVPLSCAQAEERLTRSLRQFYRGLIGCNDLQAEVSRILEQLPVVSGRPAPAMGRPAEPSAAADGPRL
jgi:hypothetical protein